MTNLTPPRRRNRKLLIKRTTSGTLWKGGTGSRAKGATAPVPIAVHADRRPAVTVRIVVRQTVVAPVLAVLAVIAEIEADLIETKLLAENQHPPLNVPPPKTDHHAIVPAGMKLPLLVSADLAKNQLLLQRPQRVAKIVPVEAKPHAVAVSRLPAKIGQPAKNVPPEMIAPLGLPGQPRPKRHLPPRNRRSSRPMTAGSRTTSSIASVPRKMLVNPRPVAMKSCGTLTMTAFVSPQRRRLWMASSVWMTKGAKRRTRKAVVAVLAADAGEVAGPLKTSQR